MSRHRRQLGMLAILARVGWQRDPGLWNVPCLDGRGHRAQLSVRLGMGWVTLDHPDVGLLYLTPPQVGKLRGALRHALFDLELFGGADLPAPRPRLERPPQVGADPPRRYRVVVRPPPRPTVADIAARLAAPAATTDQDADQHEHPAAEPRLSGMAARPAQQNVLAGPVAVVLSPDDLESLEETLDILSQPGALAEIDDSAADIAAGRTMSMEDIRAEFGQPS